MLEVLVASEIVGKVSEADIGLLADITSSFNVAVLVPRVLASKLFTTGAEVIPGAREFSLLETDPELSDDLGAKKEHAGFTEGLLVTFPRLLASVKEVLAKGRKYLVFVSSRSVKMRGFSFLSLHSF